MGVVHGKAGLGKTYGVGQALARAGERSACWAAFPSRPTMRLVAARLFGIQLWVALPDRHRHIDPHFEHHPRLPVLIMSLHGEEQFAVRALRAGASGYLTKSAAPEQLVAAIAKVVRGGHYISEALAERLAADLGPGATASPQFARFFPRGATNRPESRYPVARREKAGAATL